MPSSFAAARDFARAYPRGSRLATSAFQGDLAPSQFQPGEVSPETAIVKFAQVFLTEGARRRRAQIAESVQAETMRKATLANDRLAMLSDPNYVSAGQRESNRISSERLEWEKSRDRNPQPPATMNVTPELAAAVGHGVAPGAQDPRLVTAAGSAAGREAADDRARASREASVGRKAKFDESVRAKRALDGMKQQREAAVVAAEEAALQHVSEMRTTARRPVKTSWGRPKAAADSTVVATRDSLGLPPEFSPKKGQIAPGAGGDLVKRMKIKAGVDWDRRNAGRIARLESLVASGLDFDPEMEGVQDAIAGEDDADFDFVNGQLVPRR